MKFQACQAFCKIANKGSGQKLVNASTDTTLTQINISIVTHEKNGVLNAAGV